MAGRGLQVQSGFIFGQKNCIWSFLGYIDEFFSICSSKSATLS